MSKEQAVKDLKKILKNLPKEILEEDAIKTYYDYFDIDYTLTILIDVLSDKGCYKGSYV